MLNRRPNLQSGARVTFRKWFRIAGARDEAMSKELITLELHHGGYFETLPDGAMRYKIEKTNLSGGICCVDWIDPEKFSWVDMCNIAYELGYREKPIVFHFKRPKTLANEGWWHFKTDSDAQEMYKLSCKKMRTIPVYLTGGGVRKVQEAMDDDLDLNPPRPHNWKNPLCEMTEEEVLNAEQVAFLAAIQLHARRNVGNKRVSNLGEQNRDAKRLVEEGKNLISASGSGAEVVVFNEAEPLGSLGPLSSLNEFIHDIGTQTGVNGDFVWGTPGKRMKHIPTRKDLPNPPEEENSEEEWLKRPTPVPEFGGDTEVFAEEEWHHQVNLQQVEDEAATAARTARREEKRPAKFKKSSASWKRKDPILSEGAGPYNTRHKGNKHFEADPECEQSDSSDSSFFVDEDFDLRDGFDDEEFRQNVSHGDNVEEASEMGYGGEISDDAWDSDALSSIDGSDSDFDEEGNKLSKEQRREKRVKAWNRQVDLVNPQFALGQLFPNHETFREAVREYNIRSRRGVWFQKNQWKKIEIRCQPECPFFLYARLVDPNHPTLQVCTYRPEHNCSLQNRSPHFNYHRVAVEIREQLLADPSWSPMGIQEAIQKKYNLDIPIHTIIRGRSKARRMNEGHYVEQYNLLYAYRKELMRTNPGTTCEILCSHEDGVARFKRIYICFGALKEGWRTGCRRLIGLDGCHLKGQHPGQLLCAVGIDANNGIYPIAYAVAEVENTETWTWFMEFLKDDLGIEDSYNYCFMSDKQKGLGNAIRRWFPESEHRHCVRHMYNNFKCAGHTGEGLKQTFWNAARCARTIWFEQCMVEMQAQSQDAFNWLNDPAHQDRSPIHWSRSHFRFTSGCDILINNICEVFNATIVRARSKPILTMLEMIRIDLMTRMANRRVAVTKWRHVCGPRIVKQIERTARFTKDWRAILAGEYHYQVQGGLHGTMHCVDLRKHTCDCRKWELSGIPCVHAICSLRSRGWEPTAFVNKDLKSSAYLRAYSPILMPISDKAVWERVHAPVAPPPMKIQRGRLQMKRRPSAGESLAPPAPSDPTRLSRKGMKQTCKECHQNGHNKRRCPTLGRNGEKKRKRTNKQSKVVPDKAPKNAENIVVVSRRTAKIARDMSSGTGTSNGSNGAGPSIGGGGSNGAGRSNGAGPSTGEGGSQYAEF